MERSTEEPDFLLSPEQAALKSSLGAASWSASRLRVPPGAHRLGSLFLWEIGKILIRAFWRLRNFGSHSVSENWEALFLAVSVLSNNLISFFFAGTVVGSLVICHKLTNYQQAPDLYAGDVLRCKRLWVIFKEKASNESTIIRHPGHLNDPLATSHPHLAS